MEKPALLLLPNLLGPHKHHAPYLPSSVDKAVKSLNGLIAESEGEGRRYLGRFELEKPAHLIPIALYNKHTPDQDVDFILEPIKAGERWGYVSDAGLPCIADPGSKLVRRARQMGIQVQAYVGPSSILMGLMLSGFSGQQFTFHGYPPIDPKKRSDFIKKIEREAIQSDSTHIFMEVPFRNQYVLESLMNDLQEKTWLSVAWDLTLPTQGVVTNPVSIWKKMPLPNLEKKNALFLVSAS